MDIPLKNYIGLDIGGTKIEAVLLKEVKAPSKLTLQVLEKNFEIIERKRIPTNRDKGYEFVLNEISKLILDICSTCSLDIHQIEAIGMGLPGSITPATSIMINGNSEIFINKNIIHDLKSKLSFSNEIYVDNDANLFALAETFWGAGLKYQLKTGITPKNHLSIGVILGTGCGGGVIINGAQLIGRNGGGGEIGHSVLVKDGIDCYCGRKGCAEQYLSGTGLELMYQRMNDGKKLKAQDIFKGQDEKSEEVIYSYIEHLSLFLTNLTNIFDPDYIVLGGGVSNQDLLYKELNINNKEKSFIINTPVEIYQHQLGDSAGVLGAALFPIMKFTS